MNLRKKYCIDLNDHLTFGFSNVYDFFRDVFGEDVKINFNTKNRRYILFCGEKKLSIAYVEHTKKTVKSLEGNQELRMRFLEYLDTNEIYQRILLGKESIKKPKARPFNLFGIDSQIEELEKIVKEEGRIDEKRLLKYRPEAIAIVVNRHCGYEKYF